MVRINSRFYRRRFVLTLLCCAVFSGNFARNGTAETTPPLKPAAAFCACCPDHGMWEQQTKPLTDVEIEGLAALKFDRKAYLYSTPASPDDIKGIALSEDKENGFAMTVSQTARQLTLTVNAKNGETGKLILRVPKAATFFLADVTNGPKTWAAPNSVYKEIRLAGTIQGTGVFAQSITAQTKYRLVLQGQGGRCFDAGEFHRWNLKISGAKADFTLYGFFDKAK